MRPNFDDIVSRLQGIITRESDLNISVKPSSTPPPQAVVVPAPPLKSIEKKPLSEEEEKQKREELRKLSKRRNKLTKIGIHLAKSQNTDGSWELNEQLEKGLGIPLEILRGILPSL